MKEKEYSAETQAAIFEEAEKCCCANGDSLASNTIQMPDADRKNDTDKPTADQWLQLYEVAKTLKKLEPWNILWDSDFITIELPGEKEPVFCSVIGRNGQCYGI